MNTNSFWKYILFFLILWLYISNPSIGQSNSFAGEIQWMQSIKSNTPKQPELIYFKNAVYIDTATYLPYFCQRIKEKSDQNLKYKIQVLHAEYELFPQNQLPSIINRDQISDSIVIKYSIQIERKETYLEY